VGEFIELDPFVVLGVSQDPVASVGGNNLTDGFAGGGLGASGSGSDVSVNLLVEILEFTSLECLLPSGELLVEALGVLTLEHVVVALDMFSKDVSAVLSGVELGLGLLSLDLLTTLTGDNLGLDDVEAGESLVLVGDVETTIGSTLHGTEDTVTGGSADETNIEVSLEWTSILHVITDGEVRSINLGVSLVHIGETLVSKESTSAQETNAVRGSVVGETALEAVFLELERVSRGHNLVTLESGINDLDYNTAVSATDAETVLLGVVLVLFLEDEALSGIVVGLSLSSPAEFGLVSAGVSFVLQNFDVSHSKY